MNYQILKCSRNYWVAPYNNVCEYLIIQLQANFKTADWVIFARRVTLNDEELMYVDPVTDFWDYGNFTDPNADNPWQGRGKMAPFDQDVSWLLLHRNGI